MHEQEPSHSPSSAFISALTTEHYVLQSAISGNTSEVGTRASLYLFSLSSSRVALGFASRSPELFGPFVAIVLPALFILGVFTTVRLVDSNLEGMLYLNCIARIRQYYRTLGQEGAEHFSPESGRWPLVLMAIFFVYQQWRYDSTTAHMEGENSGSGGLNTPLR